MLLHQSDPAMTGNMRPAAPWLQQRTCDLKRLPRVAQQHDERRVQAQRLRDARVQHLHLVEHLHAERLAVLLHEPPLLLNARIERAAVCSQEDAGP